MFDKKGVVYERKLLPVGDYAWRWTENYVNLEIPYIIERKRIGSYHGHTFIWSIFQMRKKIQNDIFKKKL